MMLSFESRSDLSVSRCRMDWNLCSRLSEFSIEVMFSNDWLMKCWRLPSRSEILTLNST